MCMAQEIRPATRAGLGGNPVEIGQASDADAADVCALFSEYFQWLNSMLQQEFGTSFDVAAAVDGAMANIGTFYPPVGRLYLAKQDGRVAGCAGMRTLASGVAELKRMFVRPAYRGQGIGRALVQELIADASAAGYSTIRLDSATFMHEAHGLYRSLGFLEREPYLESEVPADRYAFVLFMERTLDSKTPADAGA
jgi:GNAT superfamily N-acetyltransferase